MKVRTLTFLSFMALLPFASHARNLNDSPAETKIREKICEFYFLEFDLTNGPVELRRSVNECVEKTVFEIVDGDHYGLAVESRRGPINPPVWFHYSYLNGVLDYREL